MCEFTGEVICASSCHPGSGPLQSPIFTKQPGSIVYPVETLERSKDVVFSCEAQGSPPPSYRWVCYLIICLLYPYLYFHSPSLNLDFYFYPFHDSKNDTSGSWPISESRCNLDKARLKTLDLQLSGCFRLKHHRWHNVPLMSQRLIQTAWQLSSKPRKFLIWQSQKLLQRHWFRLDFNSGRKAAGNAVLYLKCKEEVVFFSSSSSSSFHPYWMKLLQLCFFTQQQESAFPFALVSSFSKDLLILTKRAWAD